MGNPDAAAPPPCLGEHIDAILTELDLRMQTAPEAELHELLALLEKHSPVVTTAGLEARRA